MAFSPKFFGGAVEMTSASIHVANAIRDVYAVFEDQVARAENRGKVPVTHHDDNAHSTTIARIRRAKAA